MSIWWNTHWVSYQTLRERLHNSRYIDSLHIRIVFLVILQVHREKFSLLCVHPVAYTRIAFGSCMYVDCGSVGCEFTPTNKTVVVVCQRITNRLYSIVVRQFYMQPLWGLYMRFSWSCLVAKGASVRWIRLLEHNSRAPHFCIDLCIGHEGWFWCIIANLPLRHRDICHLTHLQVMEAVMTEFDSWASWS